MTPQSVPKVIQLKNDHNGKQMDNPVKAAVAVVHIACLNEPAFKIALVRVTEQSDLRRMEEEEKWRFITSFDADARPDDFLEISH